MSNECDLKVLAEFDSEIDASIVQGMLSANGITAGILGDNTASNLLRGSDKGLWKLVVNPEDFDEALQLINIPAEEQADE
ncbi:MAG: hypothetical protein ACI30R_08820 [Sodaliphilus sp.]